MKIFYKTRATATGGRSGHTQLDDGSLGFDLTYYKETDTKGINPEQLFALGYAACFDSALSLVAKEMALPIRSAKSSAEVGIGMRPDGAYNLDIELSIEVSGISEAEAQQLIERTHQVCPYSNATRGNVETRLSVKVV